MCMSTHVVGIRPADDTYKQMLAVWQACRAARVEIPESVSDFFGGADPDPAGVVLRLDGRPWYAGVSEWRADMQDGFEIDLRKLDPTIKILRFYNSY